jgi:hypothetical protein
VLHHWARLLLLVLVLRLVLVVLVLGLVPILVLFSFFIVVVRAFFGFPVLLLLFVARRLFLLLLNAAVLNGWLENGKGRLSLSQFEGIFLSVVVSSGASTWEKQTYEIS